MRKADVPSAFATALRQHQNGDLAAAEAAYRQIIDVQRNHVDAIHFLGLLLHQRSRDEEAMPLLAKSLAMTPANPVFHDNMVAVFQATRQPEKALEHAQVAARLKPANPLAHYNLGVALADTGDLSGAVAAYQRAIALKPGYVQALNNLSTVLLSLDRPEDAVAALCATIEISPQLAEPHHNLGRALKLLSRPDEAMESFRRAIALRDDYASAWNNLGALHQDLGELDAALRCYARAEECREGFESAGSNRLMVMNFQPERSNQELFDAHLDWARRYAPPTGKRAHENPRDPERRLRIGYVSADLRQHSVATFLEPLLASHDPAQVDVTCYAHVFQPDAVTHRFQQCAHRWRSICWLNDQQAEELIVKDQIDILIDLAGHTGEHRLKLFARRAAPVQVSYLGWQNTTGMSAIDYRISDVHVDPPGAEAFYSEKLIRLPRTFAVYRPPDQAPAEVAPPPVLKSGYVTFGSFAKIDKTTPQMLRLWSQVLARVPDSRMVLLAAGLHSQRAKEHVLDDLCRAGIAADRIELRGALPFGEYLKLHDRIDLMLDTFPFNGHTTACHALWMGVPMITLAGDRYASRMGLSLMRNLDLPQFVAESPDEFITRAIDVAADVRTLAELRSSMRRRMEQSPLMDAKAFAREFESALQRMWIDYCGTA